LSIIRTREGRELEKGQTHMTEQPENEVPDRAPEGDVDVVVIGGGAAGLNGALMLARSRRSVVVVDDGTPRNAPAAGVHGLLGREGTPPRELLRAGREEVRSYGGVVVTGTVRSAEPLDAASDERSGGPRFAVHLTDGRELLARRLLVATGVRDLLPDVPGLGENWGRGVVHCPYCHGWEVRDQPIGIIATGEHSVHQALLFRQLTEDLIYFARGTTLSEDARARLGARGVAIVEHEVAAVESGAGGITGVRLSDGRFVPRAALAVASTMEPRLDGLDGLGLPTEELPTGGRRVITGMAGTTTVTGVWVAGNTTDPGAQVGAAAAGGALAGAHINADLVAEEADRAVRLTVR
jgi:thioredoxin reductase